MTINATAVDRLTTALDYIALTEEKMNGIVERRERVTPDILIGADYCFDIILPHRHKRLENGMHLIPTMLGDIVAGKKWTELKAEQGLWQTMNVNKQDERSFVGNTKDEVPTDEAIESWWSLEAIGITKSATERDDEKALKCFEETVRYENGRYVASFPWKNGNKKQLSHNYGLCHGRLQSTLKKMKEDSFLKQQYVEIVNEQLSKDIIERCDDKPEGPIYFIPHQPVITPSKATTKVRIVYDASAKSNRSRLSLNEAMYRGPVLLPQLLAVLLRIRLYNHLLVADIEKAFLQDGLCESDRDLTRFLWVDDPDLPAVGPNVVQYRFTRIAFGIVASPFLLGAVIKYHLNCTLKEQRNVGHTKRTKLMEQCAENIYVDNIFIEVDDKVDAKDAFQYLTQVFKKASMNLREFQTDLSQVKQEFPVEKVVNEKKSKLLGLNWHTGEDELCIEIGRHLMNESRRWTKRKILACIGQNYDPLGYVGPAVLKARLLFQQLWTRKCDWDSAVPEDIEQEWNEICGEWRTCPVVKVSRKVLSAGVRGKLQLHVFTDASKVAYSAVAFLRQTIGDRTTVNLWLGKCKISPTKQKPNIPRLELLGVLIGARVIVFVKNNVPLSFERTVLWTDSKIAIAWLSTHKVLPRFVENRVREIKLVEDLHIRHVPGKDNPADIATRGTTINELKSFEPWWHGPKWLALPEEHWPVKIEPHDKAENEKELDEEENKEEYKYVITSKVSTVPRIIEYERFSRLTRMLRTVVYVMRFIRIMVKKGHDSDQAIHRLIMARLPMQQKKTIGAITANEIKIAETVIVRLVQNENFHAVFEDLRRHRKNDIVHQLGVKEENGMLVCCGRYQRLAMPYSEKCPLLIPTCHPMTTAIILDAHYKCGHLGLQSTLCKVRENFWIKKAKQAVKKTIRNCKTCKRYQGRPYVLPDMAPLPALRGRITRPFKSVGLDYFGPIMVRNGKTVQKTWVCLITCLVMRAVHMEVVDDLATTTFLRAFKRFVARRGVPEQVISDNAQTFVAAKRMWRLTWQTNLNTNEVNNYMANTKITWSYITPHAPWKGGVYERLVGVVKFFLRKALGRRVFPKDDFVTLVVETESIVNARPLTYVYDDIDAYVIRPVDLLMSFAKTIETSESSHDDGDETFAGTERERLMKQYKSTLQVIDRFWDCWYNEYLKSLREKHKMKHRQANNGEKTEPQIGDVVLIHDENSSRGCWSFGRIMSTSANAVGEITSAQVRTKSGLEVSRPINKLYPLELNDPVKSCSAETVTEIHERMQGLGDPNLESETEED